jgi:hypothetical protein
MWRRELIGLQKIMAFDIEEILHSIYDFSYVTCRAELGSWLHLILGMRSTHTEHYDGKRTSTSVS